MRPSRVTQLPGTSPVKVIGSKTPLRGFFPLKSLALSANQDGVHDELRDRLIARLTCQSGYALQDTEVPAVSAQGLLML